MAELLVQIDLKLYRKYLQVVKGICVVCEIEKIFKTRYLQHIISGRIFLTRFFWGFCDQPL